MVRSCSRCSRSLPASSFSNRARAADGLTPWCKDCLREYRGARRSARKDAGLPHENLAYYRANKERYAELDKEKRQRVRDYVDAAKDVPCTDCGLRFPTVCMDFDHLRDKKFNLQKAVRDRLSLETVQREIDKCEVVCSNCHRIRTAARLLETTGV